MRQSVDKILSVIIIILSIIVFILSCVMVIMSITNAIESGISILNIVTTGLGLITIYMVSSIFKLMMSDLFASIVRENIK